MTIARARREQAEIPWPTGDPAAEIKAADLHPTPCGTCGRQIVHAWDSSTGHAVILDVDLPAYILLLRRQDGLPLCMRPSNGMAVHRCAEREQ